LWILVDRFILSIVVDRSQMLILYNCLLPFGLLFSFPFYLRRMLKRGGYARNFLQRFGIFSGRLRRRFQSRSPYWIRAVSVGEIMTALKLIDELGRQDPGFRAVISTTTSTGYRLALERCDPESCEVIYSPIDFYPIVASVWRKIRPRSVILIDSDLWPSFLAIAQRSGTPVHLTNARLSPRSERRYRALRPVVEPLFWDKLTKVFVQDQADRKRWESIGLPPDKIRLSGSIKFDSPAKGGSDRFVEWLQQHDISRDRRILLGGSTFPDEEALLVDLACELRGRFPDLFLVLVPRHVERRAEIEQMLQAKGVHYTVRSNPSFAPATQVLLVDSTGELSDWYYTATVVFIGKSFFAIGGQNPVEPIVAGKPVVCGPHMENFEGLVAELEEANGIIRVQDRNELSDAFVSLFSDAKTRDSIAAAAGNVLAIHRHATARTVREILL
jgi:3-deoxy-D-manno-octulosonic-acid transferase